MLVCDGREFFLIVGALLGRLSTQDFQPEIRTIDCVRLPTHAELLYDTEAYFKYSFTAFAAVGNSIYAITSDLSSMRKLVILLNNSIFHPKSTPATASDITCYTA